MNQIRRCVQAKRLRRGGASPVKPRSIISAPPKGLPSFASSHFPSLSAAHSMAYHGSLLLCIAVADYAPAMPRGGSGHVQAAFLSAAFLCFHILRHQQKSTASMTSSKMISMCSPLSD
jgi:hypothetical protein